MRQLIMILSISSEYGFYCFTMFRVEYIVEAARASESMRFLPKSDTLE
jgi:hypothetical protein